MLNIPESVKTLFKTDGVHKNFRVQFPNGEYPDITNENIVRESLHFTESLCSQSVFKFGLAEASVLEFETVGVGNMYGMTINASIEIDLSSLSAAEIADIEAGTWDGEFVNLSSSDLGFPFFRVPLGVFRVNKCPRNQGAMTHRQVEAYSSAQIKSLPELEQLKLRVGSADGTDYTPTIQNLFYAAINSEETLIANGYSKVQQTPTYINVTNSDQYIQYIPVTEDQPNKITVIGESGTYYGIEVRCRYTNRHFVPGNDNITWRYSIPKDAIFSISLGQHYRNWVDDISDYIETTLLVDYDKLTEWGYSSLKDFVYEKLTSRIESPAPTILFAPDFEIVSGNSYPLDATAYLLTNDVPVFFPFLNASQIMSISLPHSVKLWENGSGGTAVGETTVDYTTLYGNEFQLYEYTTSATGLPSTFKSTGQRIYRLNARDYKINTFIDSYDIMDIAQGLLEIGGQFFKSDRLGGWEIVILVNSSPLDILPGDTDECWWDEYDVDPIGTVTVTYNNIKGKETTEDVSIGKGASRYDMTGNEVIKGLGKMSLSAINSIIKTNFAPRAKSAAFTPTELSMQGWPWMEAGDALKITAEDGTVVNTYAMRVEMDGIQHLMSTITAEGGEIVGET